MMEDYILEYWIESVKGALEDIDKLHLFTADDIKDLAEDMLISAEQEGMTSGYDAIPNPQTTIIEHLKELHELREASRDNTESILIQKIADIQQLNPRNIYVEGGRVRYLIR